MRVEAGCAYDVTPRRVCTCLQIQAQLKAGTAASAECASSTNQTTLRVLVAMEGKLLTSTLPRRDAQTAHEAALAAARSVLKQEGMVRCRLGDYFLKGVELADVPTEEICLAAFIECS